jgi:hypothetical protein
MAESVTVYENPHFGGRSKTLGVGQYRFFTPEDFNDVISSIKVPPGLCAMLYEDADDGGGYGRSVDLLEDCADLSQYNFNEVTSYISVFNTTTTLEVHDHRQGHDTVSSETFVWVRNSLQNGVFVPGHWERPRATPPPPNPVAVVSPPLPPHTPAGPTTIQVNGAQSIITALGAHTGADASLWAHATQDQMGVIGSDFRGVEEIGSAAFERASNNPVIPDYLNFWYPQKQPRDHRSVVYFKRTCVGKVDDAHIADISGTYQDHDVNISIAPNEKYRYLITDGHPREYTDIMSAQWNLSLHQLGQPNCDDSKSIAEFNFLEAEIQPSGDVHAPTAKILTNMIGARRGQDICVYGPWIYDKGHCCHAEIHPAEQIWWKDDLGSNEKRYALNVFCDGSKRFWWRDQMDDGTKLKPWGAPPIRGLFAIAFEAQLGKPAVKFEVSNVDDYNVAVIPNSNQAYNLVYQNNILVTFIPHNDAFKVSYENVGLFGTDKVRGFLALETTVGTVTQKTTALHVLVGQVAVELKFPPGTDVNKIDQRYERQVFEKVEGHYIFTVLQSSSAAVKPVIDLNGRWASGGTPGPAISVSATALAVDMSAYHRPAAHGSIVNDHTITVTFPDDSTYTGTLQPPNAIRWSNGSVWTKV